MKRALLKFALYTIGFTAFALAVLCAALIIVFQHVGLLFAYIYDSLNLVAR